MQIRWPDHNIYLTHNDPEQTQVHAFDWDDIRHFLEVVRSGTATHAASALGVNQSTVSRRLSLLEKRLGTRLFERSTTQGWVLTAAGEGMVRAAQEMSDNADCIQRDVLRNSTEVTGLVRLTISDCSIMDVVLPAIQTFCEAHPNVELELIASDKALDLATREADIAVRLTEEPPPNLVGKRIATLKYQVYGTPELVAANRSGHDDLPCITWLGDGKTKPEWIRKNFPNGRVYRVNSALLALGMACRGLGVVQISCAMADVRPEIRRLDVSHIEDGWGLWVLSHVDLRTTPRVRLLRNTLVDALEAQTDLLEGRCPFDAETYERCVHTM